MDKAKLESSGIKAQEAIERFGGNEAIYEKFLFKFKEDKSYAELFTAADANDVETAYRAAHTLKGISANLGLSAVYGVSTEVSALLKAGKLDEARAMFDDLKKVYEETLALITQE